MKDINILIVHYNTPELTECLVKSINKQVKTNRVANIYIFDNSNERPFTYRQDNIRYIDNTQKQIIDFEKWGESYPDKMEPFYSSKHCYTVQTFMDMVGEPFILMDSDILLKRDITDFWNEDMGFIGQSIGKRVLPFICFINPRILKERGITYFDDRYTYDLNKDKTGTGKYDTGYTLWANKDKIPHKDIRYFSYIAHYEGGSYAKEYFEKNHKGQITKEKWLERNRRYWNTIEPKPVIIKNNTTESQNRIETTIEKPESTENEVKKPIIIKTEISKKKTTIEEDKRVVIKRPVYKKQTEHATSVSQVKKFALTGRKVALIKRS